jgi:hypothetical protein
VTSGSVARNVKEMGKMDIGKIGAAKAVTSQPTSHNCTTEAVLN